MFGAIGNIAATIKDAPLNSLKTNLANYKDLQKNIHSTTVTLSNCISCLKKAQDYLKTGYGVTNDFSVKSQTVKLNDGNIDDLTFILNFLNNNVVPKINEEIASLQSAIKALSK